MSAYGTRCPQADRVALIVSAHRQQFFVHTSRTLTRRKAVKAPAMERCRYQCKRSLLRRLLVWQGFSSHYPCKVRPLRASWAKL